MKNLFTDSEYRMLQKAASWPDEDPVSCDCPWIMQLKELAGWFADEAASLEDGKNSAKYRNFAPFFDFIRNKLEKRFADSGTVYSPALLEQIQESFLESLAQNWKKLYQIEEISNSGEEAGRSSPETVVKAFRTCVLKYPLYGRLVTVYTFSMLEHLTWLFARLERDGRTLYLCMKPEASDQEIPPITEISRPLSDRHSGGQTAHFISFADGTKAVYKPHNADTDKILKNWLDYLCRKADLPEFDMPAVLDRGDYFYQAVVRPYAFQSEDEISHFFWKEGFLLGAVYLLMGSDFHHDNLIAGMNPIVIDTEAILDVEKICRGSFENYNVFSTVLVPFIHAIPGYMSGCAGACYRSSGSQNLPELNGRYYSAYDFPKELCRGFEKAMDCFLSHKQEAMKYVGEIIHGKKIRRIIQSTQAYFYALQSFSVPSRLSDAAEASIYLEKMVMKKTDVVFRHYSREEIADIERRALRKMDIPYLKETLTTDLVEQILAYLEQVDRKTVDRQVKYLEFLLFSQEIWKKDSGALPDEAVLAEKLIHGLDAKFCMVSERSDRRLYITSPHKFYLEGRLGAVTALGAYAFLHEGDSTLLDGKVRKQLDAFLPLLETTDWYVVCTVFEPGVAEGMGGFLAGCYFLYLMGYISCSVFETVLKKVLDVIEKAARTNRILSLSSAVLYNWSGMQYVLEKIGQDPCLPMEMRARLKACVEAIHARSAEEIVQEYEKAGGMYDSFAVTDKTGICFMGYFYGVAGDLMHLLEKDCPNDPMHPVRRMTEFFKGK